MGIRGFVGFRRPGIMGKECFELTGLGLPLNLGSWSHG